VHTAVQQWDLHLEGCHSLKEKRSVLQSLKAALRKLNLSVSEVEHQDLWQRAGVAAAAVGSDRRIVDELLHQADQVIEAVDGVRILETTLARL